MERSLRRLLALGLLVMAPAIAQQSPRRPRGLYAFIIVEQQIDQQRKANPAITNTQLHAYLQGLYSSLLNNPAVSGLAVAIQWSTHNPDSPSSSQPYDWSWMDDAFSAVAAWNALNPSQPPKTIMTGISAGFNSPQWVLDQIPSCDGLFMSPPHTPPANCGKATFQGYHEGGSGTVLPMPWNAIYTSAFQTFLTAFNAQYGSNPALVSVAVSGPTAASTEMIVPNNVNTPNQSQFGGIAPDDMWRTLLAFAYPGQPAYQNSDQSFIDGWDTAIDMFGRLFSGLTLVIWTGDGLINFSNTGFTVPSAFSADCPTPNMDCAAETTILSHFVDPTVATTDAKATGEAGIKGRVPGVPPGNLGVYAAKLLAQRTEQFTSPSAQILAGHQFATSFSNTKYSTLDEGCSVSFPGSSDTPAGCAVSPTCTAASCPALCVPQACLAPGVTQADLAGYNLLSDVPASDLIPPEQALYNVLRNYFDGTPAAALFGGTPGTEPQNYLQIYDVDFTYAASQAGAPAKVVKADGTTESVTAQALLNLVSQQLLLISEDNSAGAVGAAPASGATTAQTFTFTFSDTGTWQNLSVVDVLINSALDGRKACYIAFVPASNSLYLVDDAGDAGGPYQGLVFPSGGSISNGQCTINGAGSSAMGSGDTLTLTLAITFSASFAGDKVFYLSSQDKQGGGSGWQGLGSWAIPGSAAAGPGVLGVNPARASGLSQSFTFTFTDTKGTQDIAVANVLIASAIDGRHACYLAFVPPASLYLVDDAGDAGGPYAGMTIPGSGNVSNSQCNIGGAGASVATSGNNLALTLTINFSPSFAGNQIIYMAARSNTASSNWQAAGTVTVPAGGCCGRVGIAPFASGGNPAPDTWHPTRKTLAQETLVAQLLSFVGVRNVAHAEAAPG